MAQEQIKVWEVQPSVELVETETTERGQVPVRVERVSRVPFAAVIGANLKAAVRHLGAFAFGRGKTAHELIRAERRSSTASVITETVMTDVDVPVRHIELRLIEDKVSALLEAMRRSLAEEQDLAGRVVCEVRAEGAGEPGEPRAVYRNVPITSVREETDYSRPVYATRRVVRRVALPGFRGFLGLADFTADDVTEVVGYGKRRVSEITGYRREYDHTEAYQVQDGMRVLSVSFGRPR